MCHWSFVRLTCRSIHAYVLAMPSRGPVFASHRYGIIFLGHGKCAAGGGEAWGRPPREVPTGKGVLATNYTNYHELLLGV